MLKFLSALIAVLMLLAVACGGGDDDDSSDADSDEPTAEATDNSDGGDDAEDDDAEETDAPDDSDDEDEGDDDAVSGDHACTYITPAELSEILGEEFGEGRDYLATANGATACTWESDAGAAVFVEVLHDGGPDYYDAVHIEGFDSGFEETEVDGIGDKAIYSDIGVLDVVDGDKYISVQPVLFFSDLDELDVSQEIAAIVLANLQ